MTGKRLIAILAAGAASLPMAMSALAAHAQEAAPQADTASPRKTIALKDGWNFNLVGEATGESDRPGPDGWETVAVPHTWNRVGYYKPSGDRPNPVNTVETVDKTQGIGWYQLSFTPPADAAGQRAYLEFDAASRTAEVWLNNVRLGEHRTPFARFRFDATDALLPGEVNSIYVKVDNTQPAAGSTTEDVFPLTGDFMVRGGLYRPVSLVLTHPVHIDMLDDGGPGVYAATTSIGADNAQVEVVTRLVNDSEGAADVSVTALLLDADGNSVAQSTASHKLEAASGDKLATTLSVPSPRLWNGTADPYLHDLVVEVRNNDGTLLDRYETPFGIRRMELDPERGFILNGNVVKLHGVGLHQDDEQSDWAMSEESIAKTFDIIRDMGANTIRLAHYQHGQPIHELADKHGIVLWDEIGVVTAWTTRPDQTEAPADLAANARQQLSELIKQNYNHASVAAWGIANEVDFGPNRPDFLGRPPEIIADPTPLLQSLTAEVHTLDPNRPSILAQCCEATRQNGVPVVAGTVDAMGANRYFGWYYGQPEFLGPHLDELRRLHPETPLSVSEYGAGGAITMHSDDPLGGPIDMGGPVQPEEFMSWFHEENWKAMKDKPYLWGIWLWNAFDFGSTVRAEGDSIDINTKGLVTYDRAVKKDAWYFYRANWSDQPTVHITGRRYKDRAYPVSDIRVYSNAPATSLTVNGATVGTMEDCPDKVCVWPDVRLAEGANTIIATGRFEGAEAQDTVKWQLGRQQAKAFRIDSGSVIARDAEVQFGSDDFYVGGSAASTDQPGGRGRQPVLAEIAGTSRRDIVASMRTGDFHYRIPAEPGRYRVTLTFVEKGKQVGERVFDVRANGKSVISGLDVRAEAGAVLTALERSFTIDVGEDGLDLHFAPTMGEASVSSIEVAPAN